MGDGFPGVWGNGNIVNLQSTNNQGTPNIVQILGTCYPPLLSWVCVHLFEFTVVVSLPFVARLNNICPIYVMKIRHL